MSQRFFITGIGTGVGKTVVSAIFVQAFGAAYWKPVQSGLDGPTDSDLVRLWAPGTAQVLPESYRLSAPLSPHAAAAREGAEISLEHIAPPEWAGPLVAEGAGGLLVPLNGRHTMLDLMARLQYPVVLVSRHYLGSINHTLLSLEVLRSHGLFPELLVFVGSNPESESAIVSLGRPARVLSIPETDLLNTEFIVNQSLRLVEFYNNMK